MSRFFLFATIDRPGLGALPFDTLEEAMTHVRNNPPCEETAMDLLREAGGLRLVYKLVDRESDVRGKVVSVFHEGDEIDERDVLTTIELLTTISDTTPTS